MKKLLLAGTALVGLSTVATPAAAEGLKLDLGGFIRAYGVYADADTTSSLREFNLRRHTEIHFSGETTLDNGLTVGAHHEIRLADDTTGDSVDESYVYFAGGWGRVNVGAEDGAGYLLQVAAPSADSNIDGLRTYVQGFTDSAVWMFDTADQRLDYDMVLDGEADKITYMTPKFNGFQAGFSYAPEEGDQAIGDRVADMDVDTTAGEVEDLLEIAFRYDGEFNGVGVAFGAGYGTASGEGTTGDMDTWNIGLNLSFGAFGFGAAYLESDEGDIAASSDRETYVVGGSYDHGAYHFGLSYLTTEDEQAGGDLDADRVTVGGTYTFGPGMSFRGTVSVGEVDDSTTTYDYTQVTVGTQVDF